ncbi:MAG: amidohydrolase family protein [Acidobacteriota bacterium]|nr:amidohydrolase family protein [Acidobacteriota bacterium]
MRWIPALALIAAAAIADEPKDKGEEEKKGLPLEPERTASFVVDEGTWISLDVSSDGDTVLFELLGDLYTLPISGGDAVPLLTGMAFESMPAYSPDGSRIAFVSDRDGGENLWIADASGDNPKKLSKDEKASFLSPTWTPDGRFVIASRSTRSLGVHELWMYHVDGGSGVQLTKSQPQPKTPRNQRHNAMGAQVSPDGRYLYYARRNGAWTYNTPSFPLWQIVRRELATGDEDVVTRDPMGAFRPVLSPDGSRLVYATRFETQTGLRVRDLQAGGEDWLVYPVQRDDQESRASRDVLPSYAFLPDGESLVAGWGGKIRRVDLASGAAAEIPFRAEVEQALGPLLDFPRRTEEGPVVSRLIQAPVQSPDGSRLVFSSFGRLWLRDLPDGEPMRLTDSDVGEFLPAWSQDGAHLAYVTWSDREGGHLWRVPAAGGAPTQLTDVAGYYLDPAWVPDGDEILVLRASRRAQLLAGRGMSPLSAGLDLVAVDAGGAGTRLVAPGRGRGRPHFGPENDRVYLYSREGIQSMRLDGTDRRGHLKVVGFARGEEPTPAESAVLSPDGLWALALVDYHLWLVAAPPLGGEALTVDVYKPGVPAKRLTDIGADFFAWADGGQTVTWAVGSSFFRQPLSSVSFEAEEDDEDAEGSTEDGGDTEAEAEVEEPPAYEEIAVQVAMERSRPTGDIVLQGARVVTMVGDEVLDSADVWVRDNRIHRVRPAGRVRPPADARLVDLAGKTLIPGIVDVHAHFRSTPVILSEQEWSLLANLAYGVTTMRDPQTGTHHAFAYQDLVDAGISIGPRAYSTGRGVFNNTDFKSFEETRDLLARYKKYYRTDTIKAYVSGNRKQRQWIVKASKELEIMPTTEGSLDLKLNLTHAIDGFSGNEHSFPIVPIFTDVAELVAQSKMTYTPTLLVAYGGPWAENYFYATTEVYDDTKLRRFIPQHELYSKTARRPWFRAEEHVFAQLAEGAAKIVRRGGRVGVGGHGQLQGIQCHWEMWALHAGGLTEMETLRAATLHGAEAIGFAQDLGSIEEGKLADLVVLDANPLDDIRNTNTVRYVMKNGELYEADTLDQIWPEDRPLPKMWWQDEGPRTSH